MLTFNTIWIGSRAHQRLCAYIQHSLDWKRCRPTSLCLHSTLFGLEAVQTMEAVQTKRLCAYIQHSLDWKPCKPNAFVLTFNTLWIGSGADQRHSLDWKPRRPNIFEVAKAAGTCNSNVFLEGNRNAYGLRPVCHRAESKTGAAHVSCHARSKSCNTTLINDCIFNLCAYIQHYLDWKPRRPNVFVLTFNTLWIGSRADETFLCLHSTLFGLEVAQTKRLCAYIQHSLDWKPCRPNVFVLTFNTLWIGSGADQRHSLDWKRCRPTFLCLHSTLFGLEAVQTKRFCAYIQHYLDWKPYRPTSLCLHSTLFGLEAVQTNVFVLTFNTLWIGSRADQRLCAYIQHSLDWKPCRQTSLCLHSTLFGLEAVQTNVFVLTFNTLWIGSGADQRLCAYIQHYLDWKRCRPTFLCLYSTLFGLEAAQTNVFVLTFNTLWIGSGADQRLCAYIQHYLDWKRCRPTFLCLYSTLFGLEAVQTKRFCAYIQHSLDWKRCRPTSLFGLEAVQTNVFVLTFNTLWIGSGADKLFCAYIQHPLDWKPCRPNVFVLTFNTLWIGSGADQRHSLDWKRCRPTSLCLHSTLFGLEAVQTNVFVLTFNTIWIGSGADQRFCAYIQQSLDWKRCRPNVFVLTFNTLWIGSGADQRHSLDWKRCRPTFLCLHSTLFGLEAVQTNVTLWIGSRADQTSLCLHSTLFGLEAVQTNVFVLIFNTLWIGSRADQRLCAFIQHYLDWKPCRPTFLCLHSTLFGLEAVQTNVFVLTFNTIWIGSRAHQRLCAYIQHSLDWKRCRPNVFVLTFNTLWIGSGADQTSLCLHSTLFGLEAVQTNVFVLTFNTLWIGSGADQRLCAYIQHSLDWKRCRPTSLFGLEAVQTKRLCAYIQHYLDWKPCRPNIFVLTFNTLWIGSGADQRFCAYIQHSLDWKRCRPNVFVLTFNTLWIGSGADQTSLCLHSTLFGLEAVQTNVFVLTFNTLWIGSGADQRFCAYIQHSLDWKRCRPNVFVLNYIQHSLDWKRCRPMSLCLHSTLFGLEAVQTNVFVLTFNTLWIGSGADQRHSLDWKPC